MADETCSTCRHLRPFELAPELNTCPVVNIRIHTESTAIFGCNQWNAKPRDATNEEARASAKRMLKKHRKSFERLAAS